METAPLCHCGCGRKVNLRHKRWNRYASRRCFLSTLTKAQRQANNAAWRAKNPVEATAILSANGTKGGRAICPERWEALLEKWQDMTPREALKWAFYDGYHYGWRAKQRKRMYAKQSDRGGAGGRVSVETGDPA